MKKSAVLFVCSFAFMSGYLVALSALELPTYDEYRSACYDQGMSKENVWTCFRWQAERTVAAMTPEQIKEAVAKRAVLTQQTSAVKKEETPKIEQKGAPVPQPQGKGTQPLSIITRKPSQSELDKNKKVPQTEPQKILNTCTVDPQKKSASKRSWTEHTEAAAWL